MKVLILLPFSLFVTALADNVAVKTKVGTFLGYREVTENKALNVFKGIQFAKAPTGALRFKPPVPHVGTPDDVYNATEYSPSCHQFFNNTASRLPTAIIPPESEDCLYLNIWSPAHNHSKNLPVMFWIHGGGFLEGSASGDVYPGTYIAALGDVVVVSTNYRLGLFGYLYGGNKDEPGNVGMLDQNLALKWTNDNIEAFGGDSSKLTIFGESAGGWSVSSHVISPLSKGLFQRAIAQSGSVYDVYYSKNTTAAERQTLELAERFGCLNDELNKTLTDCLRQIDATELSKVQMAMIYPHLIYGTGFEGEFLPKNPVEAVKDGDFNKEIDFLFGVTDDEGAIFLVMDYPEEFSPKKFFRMTKQRTEEYIRFYAEWAERGEKEKEILEYYLKNVNISQSDQLKEAISRMYGDLTFVCPVVNLGKQLATQTKSGRTFSYRWMRRGTPVSDMFACESWMGICHGEDIPYVFGWPFYGFGNVTYTEEDRMFSKEIIKAWSTFAKIGEMPTMNDVEWRQSLDENSNVQYLAIDSDNYGMVQNKYIDTCDKLFKL